MKNIRRFLIFLIIFFISFSAFGKTLKLSFDIEKKAEINISHNPKIVILIDQQYEDPLDSLMKFIENNSAYKNISISKSKDLSGDLGVLLDFAKIEKSDEIISFDIKLIMNKDINSNVNIRTKSAGASSNLGDKTNTNEVSGKIELSRTEKTLSVPSVRKLIVSDITTKIIDVNTKKPIFKDHEVFYGKFDKFDYEGQLVSVTNNFGIPVKEFPSEKDFVLKNTKTYINKFFERLKNQKQKIEAEFIIINDKTNKEFIKFLENKESGKAFDYLTKNLDTIEKVTNNTIKAQYYYNLGLVYEIRENLKESDKFFSEACRLDENKMYRTKFYEIKDKIKGKNKK